MPYCSPLRNINRKDDICLSHTELRSIAAQYNHQHPDNMIPSSSFKDKAELLKQLNSKFKNLCPENADHCWIEQAEIRNTDLYNQLKKYFRPKKPLSWQKNKREWLSNYDILYVMKQYEELFKDFKFLGVFPIDFAEKDVCYLNDICGFNLKKLLDTKKTRFGLVLNLDKHNEPGSHWVSIFCNLDPSSKQYGLCFFDSGGTPPLPLIKKFIKTIWDEVKQLFPEQSKTFVLKYNNTQKQFQNTECGVFSTIFLAACLKHNNKNYRSIRSLIKSDRNDNHIHKFRDVFWRP